MLKAQVTQVAQFQKMLSQAESVGWLPGLPAFRGFVSVFASKALLP